MAISLLNPKAEVARAAQALAVNISAAKGLQDVMKTNLGPKGTLKMLVSGAGDIKITKDGNVLLHEMQIQHPTASLIARASTAQDDMTGDGTTSTVLLIGELLKQADNLISEGLHPRIVAEGFDWARNKTLELLETIKCNIKVERDVLLEVCQSSLRTKVHKTVADHLADVCVDAVLCIRAQNTDVSNNTPVDLHMIELMEMQHKTATDTVLVRGLVLDHGARHPDMPKRLTNCYILTCNVSLEYEKSEVNSGFFYKTAEEREQLAASEREFINQRVKRIVELKQSLCTVDNGKTLVVINQKGIDPISLDILAHEGIIALRRAKRRNMERLVLACGGVAVNSFDDLSEHHLGHAAEVYEHILGENKYTFVETDKSINPKSVTILIKAPSKYLLSQIKDALRDGLRAINNAIIDKAVVAGGGAFELYAYNSLKRMCVEDSVLGCPTGKIRLGVEAFAEALLIIPKTLALNAGLDVQDVLVKLLSRVTTSRNGTVGLDIQSGEAILTSERGIWDIYIVKRQIINSCAVIASNLILVDEIMRAGMSSLKG